MNRFIFIVLSALLLTFSNSGLCNESGISGTARKLQFQTKLFESNDTKDFAITVPQEVAYIIINKGGLTWNEVRHLMDRLSFRTDDKKDLTYELTNVIFNKEIGQWLLIFKPVKFL